MKVTGRELGCRVGTEREGIERDVLARCVRHDGRVTSLLLLCCATVAPPHT